MKTKGNRNNVNERKKGVNIEENIESDRKR